MPEKRPTILVVDDDPGVLALLKELLGREGYDVDVASDGIEALEKFKAKDRDILVTDLRMLV